MKSYTPPRFSLFDNAKGAGVLLMSALTTLYFLLAGQSALTAGGIGAAYYLIDLGLAPLFFFIAGIFAVRSLEAGSKEFLRNKFANFLSLYVIFSFLQGIVQIFLFMKDGAPLYWTRLLMIPFYPLGHFWFLHALMIYFAIVAMLPRVTWIYMVAAGVGFWLSAKAGANPKLGYVELVGYHFIFFASGSALVTGFTPAELQNFFRKYKYLLLPVCGLIFYVSASINFAFEKFDSQTRLTVIAGFAGLASVLAVGGFGGAFGRLLSYLGQRCFPIYLLHGIAIVTVLFLCKQAGLHRFDEQFIICMAAGVAVPLFIYEIYEIVSRKFTPEAGNFYEST